MYYSESKEGVNLEIIDYTGKVVYNEMIREHGNVNKVLDISGFAKGIYILRMINSAEIYTEKVIISK